MSVKIGVCMHCRVLFGLVEIYSCKPLVWLVLRETTVQAGWLVLNEQDHQLHRVEQDCNLTGSLILMSSLKGFLGSFNSV